MTEFQINSKGNNQISFEEVYHEKVLLRHFQGLYSNFDLTITPNSKNTIGLVSENQMAQQFLDHIVSGIKQFIQTYTENDISINGFDVKTENDKFHAVDSKPITYQIPIIEALKTIIRSPKTLRKVNNSMLTTNQYSFEINEINKQYRNVEWDGISTNQLIRTHTQSKCVNINGKIKIVNSNTDISLESNLNEHNTRVQNRIELRFKKNEFSYVEMFNYLNILNLIVIDEYRDNINPSGFILYFEKNNLDSDLRFEDKNLAFEWCLRNILNSEATNFVNIEADR